MHSQCVICSPSWPKGTSVRRLKIARVVLVRAFVERAELFSIVYKVNTPSRVILPRFQILQNMHLYVHTLICIAVTKFVLCSLFIIQFEVLFTHCVYLLYTSRFYEIDILANAINVAWNFSIWPWKNIIFFNNNNKVLLCLLTSFACKYFLSYLSEPHNFFNVGTHTSSLLISREDP